MAKDWASDVKKFAPDADDGVIAGIVRYCGIALQKPDSSLVSYTDPVELGRVRQNFLKKKLGLTSSDEELDAAIAAVGTRMKGVNFKNRVTVYYLLLEHLGLLHKFAKAGSPAATPSAGAPDGTAGLVAGAGAALAAGASATADAAKATASEVGEAASAKLDATKAAVTDGTTAGLGLVAGAGAAAAGVGAALTSSASDAADAVKGVANDVGAAASSGVDTAKAAISGLAGAGVAGAAAAAAPLMSGGEERKGGLGWLLWVLLALLALAILWWLFMHHGPAATAVAPATTTEAVVPATVDANLTAANATGAVETAAIPDGAGVMSEMRDGKPVVKVFFDTGKAVVVPAFTPAAGALKTYLDAHAGSTLGVSGFNDPTGNAAANAALSKRRAEAVKAALIASAIPDASIALVKPEAATDTAVTDNAQARRVEVYIK